MSKWIQTTKTNYNIDNSEDREIKIKGDVLGYKIFKGSYEYVIELYGNGHKVVLAEEIKANQFTNNENNTLSIDISDKLNEIAKCAAPTGQSCYIKATGKAGDVTVEYISYITLSAPSLAMDKGFTLAVSVENDIAALKNIPVVGFSKLKAVLSKIPLAYGGRITKIMWNSKFFDDVEYPEEDVSGEKTTQSFVMKENLNVFGNIKVRCTIVNSFGYSSTEEVEIKVRNYGSPTLRFTKGPFRTVAETTEIEKKKAKKGQRYGMHFVATITPYPILDDTGENINSMILYDEAQEQKAYVEINNPKDKTWNYLTSSSCTLAQITNGALNTSYSSYPREGVINWPQLVDRETDEIKEYGLAINRAYNLSFTVRDITGRKYTFVKRIPSITTTMHMRRGGGGISFGGYSTKEDTVESEYQILCNELIEAVADDSVTDSASGKGVVRGKFVEAKSGFKLGETNVTGIGTGAEQLAKGDHEHGPIKADGTASIADAVIISDSNKKIKAASTLPTSNLTIEKNTKNMMPCAGFTVSTTETETYPIPGSNQTVTTGKLIHNTPTAGSSGEAVRADHTHPYSREWMNDPIYVETIKALSTALSDYL